MFIEVSHGEADRPRPTGRWAPTETGREAKFYSLTNSGRGHLQQEVAAWERLSDAIDLIIEEA